MFCCVARWGGGHAYYLNWDQSIQNIKLAFLTGRQAKEGVELLELCGWELQATPTAGWQHWLGVYSVHYPTGHHTPPVTHLVWWLHSSLLTIQLNGNFMQQWIQEAGSSEGVCGYQLNTNTTHFWTVSTRRSRAWVLHLHSASLKNNCLYRLYGFTS